MGARKHLDDLEVEDYRDFKKTLDEDLSDERHSIWREQREIYGFDFRDTYALNNTMLELLYERLLAYREAASEMIRLDTYKIEHNEILYNQGEVIDRMIELARFSLIHSYDDKEVEAVNSAKEVWQLWSKIFPHMWW